MTPDQSTKLSRIRAQCERDDTPAAKAVLKLIAAVEDLDQVRQGMAETGKDFYIKPAQRAFPLMCNAHDALLDLISSWPDED